MNDELKFESKIFRKLAHYTDSVITKDSFHHPKHKIVAFQNYCFRAHSILKNKNDLN